MNILNILNMYQNLIQNDNFDSHLVSAACIPESTTTTGTQSSTTTACFLDPSLNQKGENMFRIAIDVDVPLDQCLQIAQR